VLVWQRDGDIVKADENGSNLSTLYDQGTGAHPSICSLASKVVFDVGSEDVVVVGPTGQGLSTLNSVDASDPDCGQDGLDEYSGTDFIAFKSDENDADGDIHTMNMLGGSEAVEVDTTAPETDPAWCRQRGIAFAREANIPHEEDDGFRIFIWNTEFEEEDQVTPDDPPVGQQDVAPDHRFPACSQDSTWLAYERTVSNGGSVFQTNVWRKNLDTSDPPEDMTGCQTELVGIGYYEVGSPTWSPGGRYILFRSDRGGSNYYYDIGKLPVPQEGDACYEPEDVQWITDGPYGSSNTEPDWGEL
jgi:hypothetical protein